MTKPRIEILDGFRAVAILGVILYHFFSRWAYPESPYSLYPYGNKYAFFPHGRLGVQFFFIISGFVIFFTLDNTSKLSSFWKKRMIRLWPAMVVASLITLIFFILFDQRQLFPDSHEAINLIQAITFFDPQLLNMFFASTRINFEYLNGSYWSLWPEIQFYTLASVLFYHNKNLFVRNFICVTFLLAGATYLYTHITGSNKLHLPVPEVVLNFYLVWFIRIFNIVSHIPFFAIGILFYVLYKNSLNHQKTHSLIAASLALLIFYEIYSGEILQIRITYFIFFLLFFLFIYLPNLLTIFTKPLVTSIGRSSYFLYLIHENMGVFLIATLAPYFYSYSLVFTILLILCMVWVSQIYTDKVDNRITRKLKKLLLRETLA